MGRRNQSLPLYAKKQQKSCYNGKDRISELPDEILIFILSLLTMEEATRTSVISHRWTTLWGNLPNLHFDGSKILYMIEVKKKSVETESSKFRRWVNQVVKLYQGPVVEEFRVRFELDQSHKLDIDAWLHFAIRKRVKILELDLADYSGESHGTSYTFPCMRTDARCLRSRPLSFSDGCNSLTYLRLNCVDVTGESIEYLLSSCLLLEELFVQWSYSLVDLKVDGTSLKLKILQICNCDSVKNIEISAINLVSFTFMSDDFEVKLSLKNAPKLVELHIRNSSSTFLSDVFCQFSNYLFQLESLTLDSGVVDDDKSYQIPVLYNLKHLKLIVWEFDDESLRGFASLTEACPFLSKFSLQMMSRPNHSRRKIERVTPRCSLKNLKVIEFLGFVGQTVDVQFATYLIENSCKLEKVIFDTRDPWHIGTICEYDSSKERRAAKKRLEQFGKKLPRGPDLVII